MSKSKFFADSPLVSKMIDPNDDRTHNYDAHSVFSHLSFLKSFPGNTPSSVAPVATKTSMEDGITRTGTTTRYTA